MIRKSCTYVLVATAVVMAAMAAACTRASADRSAPKSSNAEASVATATINTATLSYAAYTSPTAPPTAANVRPDESPITTFPVARDDQGSGPGRLPGAASDLDRCPAGMVLVEGDYCTQVEQTCLRWLEPPTDPYAYYRCAEYKKPGKCVGKKV